MDLKNQLVRAGRVAVERGLVVGSGGNLSAREPGSDEFIVTRSGVWLDRLDESSFTTMRVMDDEVPDGANPSVEWELHQLTYRERPDVNSVMHLHPQRMLLLDAAGLRIRQITTDHVYYLGDIGYVGYHMPGSLELAQASAEVARDHDVMILHRHGCSSLGGDVDMALRRALNLGEAADLTFQSYQLDLGEEITFPTADRLALSSI